MQNNKAAFINSVIFLIIGFVAAWLIFGYQTKPSMQAHMMPDGTMMNADGSSMATMMHDMNAALRGKAGDEFDKAFLAEMIVHHQGAVDMAELAQANAEHQKLKDFSSDIITLQEKEIEQMKAWQKEWYGN